MNPFPAADPIPLPAPVWLFKALSDLTLTLHMVAVELLIGGLLIGLLLSVMGRARGSSNMIHVSGMIAHRLPTVMALLINLGVPPLLFAQVLYGRAIYTSSVLIGAYWISVILLLMASYYGLYHAAKRADSQRSWTSTGLGALILILAIGFIYSNNMTLMLRPQVWGEMYRTSPAGVQWNTSDPTLLSRWLFYMFGSLPVAGGTMMLLGLRRHFDAEVREFLYRFGGGAIVVGVALQAAIAPAMLGSQPGGIVAKVMANPLYGVSAYLWVATAAAAALAGLWALRSSAPAAIGSMAAAAALFLNAAAAVIFRDGVRDLTLLAAGFDVWNRAIVTNWSVVLLFVGLLLVAIAALVYLILVVAKARVIEEKYA